MCIKPINVKLLKRVLYFRLTGTLLMSPECIYCIDCSMLFPSLINCIPLTIPAIVLSHTNQHFLFLDLKLFFLVGRSASTPQKRTFKNTHAMYTYVDMRLNIDTSANNSWLCCSSHCLALHDAGGEHAELPMWNQAACITYSGVRSLESLWVKRRSQAAVSLRYSTDRSYCNYDK